MHWLVGGRGVQDLLNETLQKQLGAATWLTHPGYPPLYGASVQSGETLERIVLDALRHWFTSRRNKDFMDNGKAKEMPDHIQRWAAHFFLSTSINIAATSNNANIIPSDFFFEYETLRGYSDLLVSLYLPGIEKVHRLPFAQATKHIANVDVSQTHISKTSRGKRFTSCLKCQRLLRNGTSAR